MMISGTQTFSNVQLYGQLNKAHNISVIKMITVIPVIVISVTFTTKSLDIIYIIQLSDPHYCVYK